jgi:hypothetical protein
MVSIYRAKLISIIKPSVYLSIGTGILLFVAIFITEDFQFDVKMLEMATILSAVLFIFGLLWIGVCTFFYKITINKDGLSSYNPWESFKCYHMKWVDMEYLTIKSVLGYKYYHITSQDQQESLWVPCNIKHKGQFIIDLRTLIKDNHVLMQHIKIT